MTFPLFIAFAVALVTSLSAAQIIAGIIIIAGLFRWKTAARWWAIALGYVLFFILLDASRNGLDGAFNALRNTWTILLAPAVVSIGKPNEWPKVQSALIYGFSFFSVIVIAQFWLGVEGRYGFHSSPYAAALLLIPISFFPSARPIWLLLAVAIVLLKSRFLIAAWFIAFLSFRAFGRKRLVIIAALLIFAFVILNPLRWSPDLMSHSSFVHRLVIWSQVTGDIAEAPFIGHGFEQFRGDTTVVSPEWRQVGVSRVTYRAYVENQENPHSGYLMMAHAAGLTGYLLMWTLFGAIFYFFRKDIGLGRVVAAHTLVIMIAALMDKTFFMTLPMLEYWFLLGWAIRLRT